MTDTGTGRQADAKFSAMIVGAEKAGTTALLAHLALTPEVLCIPALYIDKNLDISSTLRAGLPDDFVPGQHVVVGANAGLSTERAVLSRIRQHSPDVKVIFVLREPISRAISAHTYHIYWGGEQEDDFSNAAIECLNKLRTTEYYFQNNVDHLHRGLYSGQVANLIDMFGRENCLFLCFEALVGKNASERTDTLKRISAFLGVSHAQTDTVKQLNAAKEPRSRILATLMYRDSFIKRVASKYLPVSLWISIRVILRRLNARKLTTPKPEISPDLQARLHEYFRDDVHECERLTGLKLIDRWGYRT